MTMDANELRKQYEQDTLLNVTGGPPTSQEWLESRLLSLESKHAEEMRNEIDQAKDELNWTLCKCVDAFYGVPKSSITGKDFRDLPEQIASLRSRLTALESEREKELREAIAFGRDWEIYAPHDRIADTDEEVFAAFLKTKEGK
jgi:hypothetical protein